MGYWKSQWNGEQRLYSYVHKPNEKLNGLYSWLCRLGYEMSDEEKAMQDGSHEVFQKEIHI